MIRHLYAQPHEVSRNMDACKTKMYVRRVGRAAYRLNDPFFLAGNVTYLRAARLATHADKELSQ